MTSDTSDAHEWWPYLSIGAKHAVLVAITDPLPEHVRDEIHMVTGRRLLDGAQLSEQDRLFIQTQIEPVD
ncbi:hypothetical protein ASD65_06010 [Microbacterium sp. Root61]|uniref:hypothetical protein n=1 Tax=Microbacterium sp. Root61 TaxID=1736570 RepID=UPI0006FDBF78|nr:hypothetical protein [Microbacterium sp. Root61]KRA24024.1 hypothetical protein ASD65_06010 [Microbacterium sp. Root61]